MSRTVPMTHVIPDIDVDSYRHLLTTYTYTELAGGPKVTGLAAATAYAAVYDPDPAARALAYARLPLVHDEIDRRPEARDAERRRLLWQLCAGLDRVNQPRNWVVVEQPATGGVPFWRKPYHGYTPALAYLAFTGLAAATHHRIVLKEAGK